VTGQIIGRKIHMAVVLYYADWENIESISDKRRNNMSVNIYGAIFGTSLLAVIVVVLTEC
jgi:hypothetical protein